MSKTLYDKLWENHVVHQEADGTALLYIDRHLVHEVTSPQAFEGLKLAGRKPWRVSSIVATADHNTPTDHWDEGIKDPFRASRSRRSTPTSAKSARWPTSRSRIRAGHRARRRPENGATLPGMTVVCGDSHTSTHGAFRLPGARHRHLRSRARAGHPVPAAEEVEDHAGRVDGKARRASPPRTWRWPSSARIGTAGGTGYAIEFGGSAIRGLSMEGRMTLCNMAIEGGRPMGFVAVDDTTINYLKGRPFSPKGDLGSGRRLLAHPAFRCRRAVRPRRRR
jgi:3-isopropylmalate/(R)-2-methylmalate dehydratase large subunit